MLKNIYKCIGTLSLLLFSFYYTDRAVDIVKRNDPIMKKIVSVTSNYEIKPISATIDDETIVPGINGIAIDIDKSYEKMKQVNGYYESMLTFTEVVPDTTILNTYDKFIVKGNGTRSEVALLFKVDDVSNLEKIYKILLDKNVTATFFIDGEVIENNTELIYKIASDGYEIENFGYNDAYTKQMFDWTNNLIFSITNINPKFCYSEYNNYDILELCKSSNMYTVKPTVVTTNPFITIKNSISEGMIYSLDVNNETLKEIATTITYIKQKGYDLVNLNEIILENRTLEK